MRLIACSLSVLLGSFVNLMNMTALAADSAKAFQPLGSAKTASPVHELKEVARYSDLPAWATSVAFSADDQLLAVGLKDAVALFDVPTKRVIRTIELKAGQVRSLAFSSDGAWLAVGGYQTAKLFRAGSGDLVRELKGHRGYVTGVAFSPDSKRLATACEDEVARVWTLVTEPSANKDLADDAASLFLKGHTYPVTGVAWSADGQWVATSAGDDTRPTKPGQVKVWDSSSAEVKHQFELHSKSATGVAFTPDGRFLLSTSVDERVNVYDLKQGKPVGFFAGHSRPTNAVAVHPDGETAISVSGGRAVGKNELIVWELETGEVLASVEAHEARITSLAISHNGRLVATASQDQTVAIWNIAFLAVGLPEAKAPVSATADAATAETLATPKSTAEPQGAGTAKAPILRAGIIGLDTSHAGAFTKTLNANPPVAGAAGCRVIAAYPKGSLDIKASVERVPAYTEEVKQLGVEIVDSIDDLLQRVDVILLETNDGRPHFDQVLPCLKAGKPCFIDKPIAGSLADAVAIFAAAKHYNVPVFSSSSLRFGKNSLAVRSGTIGKVTYCETSSPASLEPSHPDLFWYGVHGVESLFTVMGTGCQSVRRTKTTEGKIEVTGQWPDGRVGVFREGGGYQGKAIGEKGESQVGAYDGYDPLVFAIVKFFQLREPPVTAEETLEIYAFMEAADESVRQNGASVTLESVLVKARIEAAKKVATLK